MDEADLNMKSIRTMGLNERRITLKKLQTSPLRLTPEFQEKIRLIKALDSGQVFTPRETQKVYQTVLGDTYSEPAINEDILYDLSLLKVPQLRKLAGESGVKGTHKMRKAELIAALQA